MASASSTTTAFLQSTLASERPIFSRQRVAHVPPHPVTHLEASNYQVVLVLANKTLQRINQVLAKRTAGAGGAADAAGGGSTIETIDFSNLAANAKVHYISLDPLGSHLILGLRPNDPEGQPDLIYLNRKSQRPRVSSKAKGHLITAVAWSTRNTSELMTGPILLGTSKGMVIETEFDSGEDKMFSSSLEKHWKPLINLGLKGAKGNHLPITGLSYFNVEGTKRFFVLLTTANRLYQFHGQASASAEDRPLLVNIFTRDSTLPEKFLELPSTLKSSCLSFSYQTRERGKPHPKHPLYPISFGWMTESGIYSGRVEATVVSGILSDTVTVDCQLLHFPESGIPVTAVSGSSGSSNVAQTPIAFLLTEFHAVMVYTSGIKGICLLNEQVVFSAEFDASDGKIKGMARDPISGAFYVFSDYVVHKFRLDREERNVWRIYLERSDFDLAQQYCQGDEEKLNAVLTKQADHLFQQGQYVESAMHYAKTRCSFEEISLKFMPVEEKTALLNFLKKRLEIVRPSELTQMTLIVVWLIENYLSLLRKLQSQGKADEAERVKEEFLHLLQTPKVSSCVNQSKNAVYDLLANHGDKATLVQFASYMRDWDRLIKNHLQNNEHVAVLKILREQRKPELFYQYGPELMQVLPEKFIDAVIEQGRNLSPPTRILPALVMAARKDQELEAIRYLEFSINVLGRKEPALHNFLISLYVKHEPEAKIEQYLERQGYDPDDIPYDVEYTLRLFEENGLKRAALVLYCILGQLDEAVEIALEVDLAQAERCLDFAKGDDAKRKIWLRIAQYVVMQKKDIVQAMDYLKRSNNLINIEDILPFFPDFVTIDHFKEAICEALEKYSKHIEELRKDMEESNQSADVIRAEIQQHKSSYIFVRAVDTCSVCNLHLMSKPFHLFNCGHRFHTSCLIDEVTPYLTPARKKKLEELRNELRQMEGRPDCGNSIDSKSTKLSRKDQLRTELDDLIAYECFYCGELMIKMVDQPLIEEGDFENVLREWL